MIRNPIRDNPGHSTKGQSHPLAPSLTLNPQGLPCVPKIKTKVLTPPSRPGGLTPPHPSHFSPSLRSSHWSSLPSFHQLALAYDTLLPATPHPTATPVYTCECQAWSPAQVRGVSPAQVRGMSLPQEDNEPKLLGAVAKPPSFSGRFTLAADFLGAYVKIR